MLSIPAAKVFVYNVTCPSCDEQHEPLFCGIFKEALRRKSPGTDHCTLFLRPVLADQLTSCCVQVLCNHVTVVQYVVMHDAGCNAWGVVVAELTDKHVAVTNQNDTQRFLLLVLQAQRSRATRAGLDRWLIAQTTCPSRLQFQRISAAGTRSCRASMPLVLCEVTFMYAYWLLSSTPV